MITIKVEGTKEIDAFLRKAKKAQDQLEDLSKPLTKIKEQQTSRWAKNFTSEGGVYDRWAPLADWTLEERDSMGFGSGPILVRNGTLLAHFVEQNEAGEVTNDAINWEMSNKGGSRGYAAATVSHHSGYDTALGTHVPARKLWDLDEKDVQNAEKILEKYVDSIIKRYF